MKKIVLLCASGMSTSLLVSKMEEEMKERGFEGTVEAHSISGFEEHTKDADLVLLGPQVRFQLNRVKSAIDCPIEFIEPVWYGRLDAKSIINHVIGILGE